MDSIKNIYKIGRGPSSSHTMAPQNAATLFKNKYPDASRYSVELYGSLALTGKGHLTDKVILETLGEDKTKIIFNYEEIFKYHPNAMKFKAYNEDGTRIDKWLIFGVGGGELKELNEPRDTSLQEVYFERNMEEILEYCKEDNKTLLEYIDEHEDLNEYLNYVWKVMESTIIKGLDTSGILPGKLQVKRKANDFYQQYLKKPLNETYLYATALAVSEENASGGMVVTAPTCGASGVLPAVLAYAKNVCNKTEQDIINALKIAGLIGLLAKCNASISGAEVGCQGEVGVACSMAAAAYAYLLGGTNEQIEYAAEIALEHHLGLTCDPVNGEVQIPCIERNAIASTKAIDAAKYSLLTDGTHYISLDYVFSTIKETGLDLSYKYKETSKGGLAKKEGNNE
mgnify:CR=1 FL=1